MDKNILTGMALQAGRLYNDLLFAGCNTDALIVAKTNIVQLGFKTIINEKSPIKYIQFIVKDDIKLDLYDLDATGATR